MIIEAIPAELVGDPTRWAEVVRPAFDGAVQATIHNQTQFEGSEIRAALDYSRALSRLFITVGVATSVFGIGCGAFLLIISGGEQRKLEQARTVFKNVAIGLVVSVMSYLILSVAISLTINVIGLPETVGFWQASVYEDDFGVYALLEGNEYALQGEVIMLDGPTPVVCSASLPTVADEAGWNWHADFESTGLGICQR